MNRHVPSTLSPFEAPAVAIPTTVPDDLQRILSLPRREPVDCEREPGTRRWAPATQALVEVVTAQYTRGPRLSCGCRDRTVESLGGGRIIVYHAGLPNKPPPLPVELSVDDFCRDNAHNPETVSIVSGLRRGQRVELKGLGAPFCLVEFNPFQAWTMYELPVTRGATGFVSVGAGKTIAGIMAPLAVPDRATWALLAKPDQRIHYQKAYLRLREHFRVPSMVFDQGMGGSYNVSDAPTVRFIPYSLLSNPKSTVLLEGYKFDAMVADESHLLGNRQSSRTMRMLRFVAQRERETGGRFVFVDWSGSKIKRSMKDTTHLAAHALGLGSPYPLLPKNVEAFAKIIDPSHAPDTDSDLCNALKQAFGVKTELNRAFFVSSYVSNDEVLAGYREHIIRTPGVISTKSSAVTCSITVRQRKAPKIPPLVKEALAKVRIGFRPDGEELVDAAETALCAWAVGAGFYHYWAFPKHPCNCVKTADGEVLEFCKDCLLIEDWYAKRKAFNKELRSKCLNGEPYLDSRKLCEEAAERAYRTPPYSGELPLWPAITWPQWAEIENKVDYEERIRWIGSKENPDDPEGWFLAKDAAEWAQEKVGIVWVRTPALGQLIARLAGINYHGGGPGAEARIHAEDGKRSIVASYKAHGTGRDELQFKFHRQLQAEPLASGDMYEQCLDAETEVLTNLGWLTADDTRWKKEPLIAAYSIGSEVVKWQQGRRVARSLADETMYGIKNPHLDIRVTAGHRMAVQPYVCKHHDQWTYSESRFFEACDLPSKGRIPVAGLQSAKGVPLTDDELIFVGLFLTDGNRNRNSVSLFQSERYPQVVAEIERVLASCKFKVNRYVNARPSNFGLRKHPLICWCIPSGKNLRHKDRRHLRGWFSLDKYLDKNFSILFEQLTRSQLQKLLYGMWLGDGGKTAGTYSYDKYTSSTKTIGTKRRLVADRIQSLCVRRGMRCNVTIKSTFYIVHISEDQRFWSVQRKASDARPLWGVLSSSPNERVWCVSVKSGAIITRRNGKVAIVGNCLGRLAREGQPEDTIETEIYQHVYEYRDALRKAIMLAQFIEAKTGNRQLLLAADVDFNTDEED